MFSYITEYIHQKWIINMEVEINMEILLSTDNQVFSMVPIISFIIKKKKAFCCM